MQNLLHKINFTRKFSKKHHISPNQLRTMDEDSYSNWACSFSPSYFLPLSDVVVKSMFLAISLRLIPLRKAQVTKNPCKFVRFSPLVINQYHSVRPSLCYYMDFFFLPNKNCASIYFPIEIIFSKSSLPFCEDSLWFGHRVKPLKLLSTSSSLQNVDQSYPICRMHAAHQRIKNLL